MDANDLQELYNSLRGSRAAMSVTDARSLFMERQLQSAYIKLLDARTTYNESRTRLLKQDPEKTFVGQKDAADQIRRLKRKQKKAQEILTVFDDLLGQLEKKAEREIEFKAAKQQRAAEAHAALSAEAERAIVAPSLITTEFLRQFQQSSGDEQLDVIGAAYGFQPIESEQDIHANAVYFIRSESSSYLVHTPPTSQLGETILLTDIGNQKAVGPLSRQAFVDMGLQRKMVLLLVKARSIPKESESRDDLGSDQDSSNQADALEKRLLDMGAFSQLLDSAQRSGLVPGADAIGFIRDREFRKGQYDLALLAIEGIASKFNAAVATRVQHLRQEDTDIASGRIKMSPKDLQAKRNRDRQQDQAVERARHRFNTVLDGLRAIVKNS